ncbi:MAG TPA: hypothetical protein VHG93_19670, partial [Longimicrobium sp.]|nr:hypothetical protein [Longimicrobium sp.]
MHTEERLLAATAGQGTTASPLPYSSERKVQLMPHTDLDESGREQSTLTRVVFGVRIGLGISVALL